MRMVRNGLAAIACLAATPAAAQTFDWFSPGAFDSAIFNAQADTMLRRSHKIIFKESVEESLRRPAAPTPRVVRPPVPASMVQQVATELAASFPVSERAKAKTLFLALYGSYGRLERKLGITPGDPAGGLASLIAASYMVFADAEVSEAGFAALYAQVRGAASQSAAPPTDAHDQATVAILAAYLAATREALKEHPDPARTARLKAAGSGYLKALLALDPARVRIGERGLILR